MTTLLAALERALAATPTAPVHRHNGLVDHDPTERDHPVRRTGEDWTVEDFNLLLRDPRPSAQRIVAILNELCTRPEIEIPFSDLATATGLTRREVGAAVASLTQLCKRLGPNVG